MSLNDLLKVENTTEFVQELCEHLPALLAEFHDDLQQATVKDLLDACLRTLSYFMFYPTLVAKFSDAQVSKFLSDIVSLLFSTQDEVRKHARHFLLLTYPCLLDFVTEFFFQCMCVPTCGAVADVQTVHLESHEAEY